MNYIQKKYHQLLYLTFGRVPSSAAAQAFIKKEREKYLERTKVSVLSMNVYYNNPEEN